MSRKYLGGLLAGLLAGALASSSLAGAAEQKVPRTRFETSEGATWTSAGAEKHFIKVVNELSDRVRVHVVGRSFGRPVKLVKVGAPKPATRSEAQDRPTVLFVCSQHGDEPAPREACLSLIRDLAFTNGSMYVQQLREMTLLFMPTTNPEGMARGTPANGGGRDVYRDHLNLATPETRAVARVLRAWRPDVVLDMHEFLEDDSPYDEEVLYTTPRNLNADEALRDASERLGDDYIRTQAVAHGYASDHHSTEDLDSDDVHRATDEDEGLLTNAAALRQAVAVAVESAIVRADDEDEEDWRVRRADVHLVAMLATLQFLRDEGADTATLTRQAARRKTAEGRDQSAPVYFDGSDNDPPTVTQDPPPCAYLLTDKQFKSASRTMALLDIAVLGSTEGAYVPLGQPSEPLIPLLLDSRGLRNEVSATAQMSC